MDIRLVPDLVVMLLLLVHAITCLRWLMVKRAQYLPLLLDQHRWPLLLRKAKWVILTFAGLGTLIYAFIIWRICELAAHFGLLGASGIFLIVQLSVACVGVLWLRCVINLMVVANAMIFRQRPVQGDHGGQA
jgi:hypothetical protein